MKRCSLFCAGWWPFLVFPLLLLLPLLFMQWHPIEEKVAENAKASLAAADIDWAGVETFNRGRSVLLTGTAPSEEALQQAMTVVDNTRGVRDVTRNPGDSIAAPIPLSNPELNAIVTGESVVLRGILADQATVDAVVAEANSSFGAANVVNKLIVSDNIDVLPNIAGLFSNLSSKAVGLDTLTASLKNNIMTLRGEVPDNATRDSIANQVAKIFPNEINNQLTIKIPAPAEPVIEPVIEPVAEVIPTKNEECRDRIRVLLENNKVNFETGRAAIRPSSYELLDNITQAAKLCPEAAFEVAGHTDSTGSLSLNMSLSEQRAQAVTDYLVNQGLNRSRFNVAGYGPNQPVGDNDTREGRAQNRRIEFTLKN